MRRSTLRLAILLGCAAPSGAFLSSTAGCDSSTRSSSDSQYSFAPEADAEDPCGKRMCSSDLHSVLDSCGKKIMDCPENMGCGGAGCVPACAAAKEGSVGCDFFVPIPAGMKDPEDVNGSCFAAFISNTWQTPVNVHAEYGKQALDLSKSTFLVEGGKLAALSGPIPVGGVAVLFLAQDKGRIGTKNFTQCPSEFTAVDGDVTKHGSGIGPAFALHTDAPVSAYSIYPYGGMSSFYPSATMLYPVPAWGTQNYLVNSWKAFKGNSETKVPTASIVASEDNTEVTIVPSASIRGMENHPSVPMGQAGTWTLQRGEALQLSQTAELTGSAVQANKPIALFGGHTCLNIDEIHCCCDVDQEQLPGLQIWGSSYAAVPYEGRIARTFETLPWRIVGGADGTALTYLPSQPPLAPSILMKGEVVTFWTDKPFTVRSQDAEHPFYVAGYMTGGGMVNDQGDPEVVNVVPDEQFLSRYVFYTDVTYNHTQLVVVRRPKADGEMPEVELDCAGNVTGWRSIRDAAIHYAYVDIVKDGKPVQYPDRALPCTNGRHEITSDGPFSVTVWGYDPYSSYGYPGGSGARITNNVPAIVR